LVVTGTYAYISDDSGELPAGTQIIPASDVTITGFDSSTPNPAEQLTVGVVSTDPQITPAPTATYSVSINPIQYTLTYTAGDNGSITGTTPQTVTSGSDGTAVSAVPASGYYFVNWSDSSTTNPRTDTKVSANISVTANFAANPVSTGGGGGGGGIILNTNKCKFADINCDGSIDRLDFSVMMSLWGKSSTGLSADLNHDGIVNELDFSILMLNWGL
jgi:hypothetical protein